MAIAQEPAFHYEVEESADATGWTTTRIKCHGRLVSQSATQVKELVKPLIARGGRIVIDLADLNYIDSSGLGALVGLKVSALHQGLCKLELENLTPRIKDLLTMTNLMQLFSS
jgi:anti-sigma B factor antagonist